MQFTHFLYSVASFFTIITSMACRIDDMPQTEIPLSDPSSRFVISQLVEKPYYDEFGQLNFSKEIITPSTNPSSTVTNPKYDHLSAKEFGLITSNVLSPEIFTHPNPSHYLINQAVGMSPEIAYKLVTELRINLQKNRFPPSYKPYAEALLALLYTHSDLVKLRRGILVIAKSYIPEIGSVSSYVHKYAPELVKLYAPDVFADREPPSRVLQEVSEMPQDKIADVMSQLATILWNGQLPRSYVSYAQALQLLLQHSRLKWIRKFYDSVNKS